MSAAKRPKVSSRDIISVLWEVALIMWRISPGAVIVQVCGVAIDALLPLGATYFAALSTTGLAEVYAGRGDTQQLLFYVVATVVLGIVSTFWSTVQSYVEQLTRYRLEAAVSDEMFARLHALDFWRYDDPETISMFEKARSFTNSFQYLFSQLTSVVSSIISLATGLWILAAVSWWLGLIMLVAIIPSSIVQVSLSRLQVQHWRDNVETRRREYWLEGMISRPAAIAELRLYGLIRHLLAERGALRDKNQLRMIEYERSFMGRRLGSEVVQALAEVVALVWVVLEIVAHRQPIGQFVLVQQMVSRVMSGVSSLTGIYNSIDEDLANMAEYKYFMSLPTMKTEATSSITLRQKITVERVSFTYHGMETPVLKEVSLDIARGQHVAIVGENGAGKTTLIKLLTGLYAPTSGAILIDGKCLRPRHAASWHRDIAVLGQDFLRYDFATAADNVWYGDVSLPKDEERMAWALEQAEAADFVSKLPQGGGTYVDKWMEVDGVKGVDLSGGQWQRLALARNFYRDASVIILDEPTSAIDAAAEARIFQHLFHQKEKTIITVSHRLSTVKKADRIFVMAGGKIIEQGTYQELVAARGAFYEMFKAQM
ncbi:MAG: ABC transporter ATP-binding protein [Candidatus Saccharibacteria bacterium]|nr:ABC transporter ATP-binding protein [Candidatus Saccharibacteria bacterium]